MDRVVLRQKTVTSKDKDFLLENTPMVVLAQDRRLVVVLVECQLSSFIGLICPSASAAPS